jgi:hypothetical protein
VLADFVSSRYHVMATIEGVVVYSLNS